MNNKKNTKESRYQRYNREHPTISIRLSKHNFEIVKKMANGKALGPYCADTLLNLHCNNCKAMLKKHSPEIQKFLDAQEVIKSLFKENESLKSNIEDWQIYAGFLQEKIETLMADSISSEHYTKLQEKVEVFQRKLDEREKSFKDLLNKYEELEHENNEFEEIIHSQKKIIQNNQEKEANLEDMVKSYKRNEADLRCKITWWEAWWATVTEDKSDLLQNLAKEVGVSQTDIFKDLFEYGLAHCGDIYIENLETL